MPKASGKRVGSVVDAYEASKKEEQDDLEF
jgi:hypothetical protein